VDPVHPRLPKRQPPGSNPLAPAGATPGASSLVSSAPPPAAPGKVQPDRIQRTLLESGDAGRRVGLDFQLSPVHRRTGRKQPRRDAFFQSGGAGGADHRQTEFRRGDQDRFTAFRHGCEYQPGSYGVIRLTETILLLRYRRMGPGFGLSAYTVTAGLRPRFLQDSDFSQYQNPMYLRLTESGECVRSVCTRSMGSTLPRRRVLQTLGGPHRHRSLRQQLQRHPQPTLYRW